MNMASIALARVYQQSFEHRPYWTLAVTNGALNALGDSVAQWSETCHWLTPSKPHEEQQKYDIPRTLRFFAFGFGMGPVIGRWNFFLERNFPLRPQNGSNRVSARALAKRVGADQLLMAPLGLCAFLGSMSIMEGRDTAHMKQKFKDLYLPLISTNWQVWPMAQLINFRYMPLPYRVPFQSTCGVFWTLYLSMANSREEKKQEHLDRMRRTTAQ
ncbi:hypothetical protein QCA50_001595 [Cerrena zonata]|uniref:Uncharacterized protein n=1 Tax=Cerrena zonata TaxID=2478898 RepID=A0AAW0GRE2_9APHY